MHEELKKASTITEGQGEGRGGESDDDNSSPKANGTINPHRAEER
jgi:hypothetical protein